MQVATYEVAGGWHAQDDQLRIACFGRTEEEALKALALAQTQAGKLRAIAAAGVKRDLAAREG